MTKRVLFLCTGNYYRSRYAEAVFNHLAREMNIDAVATSRGLKINMAGLVGTISTYTLAAVRARNVTCDERAPIPLTYGDLQKANVVIALKEAEHRAMLDANFPGWSQRVLFWHVHDIDVATPDIALAEIEASVHKLLRMLKTLGTATAEDFDRQ